ncbi:ammonia channel protein [Caldimicrobium thiodismutans]|jgi:Amt family ammonium transporter|uniref:Ammonium transporter n=1 Tax=Caldimicrobium thiodismutans TaxID=1653476 RepID=A0A0U5ANS0_9BACT|nr:ammonium transporter [Caldimicrobium thiodismutans]BAU23732.1 ammonia channel protein [Caldimicrobium thiodismutans]
MFKRGILSLLALLLTFGESLAEEAQTPKLNSGDTAWMLVSTALVVLMTIPGLALFYGGLSKKKDVLNTIVMSFIAYAIVSFLWVLYGYSLAFNGDIGGVIGSLSKFLLHGVTMESLNGTIPEYLFVGFQLTFAAITVALISGSYIERMKFSAWVLFTILWFSFVYVPVAHWVWGGGFLAKLSALDFAGGTVVHINAGIAGLVGALFLGKRKDPILKPHNLTLVAIGTGLLWFGWFGFNAGSAVASNALAAIALLNTNTATALAAITWMLTEKIFTRKATLLGFCSGAVAGLVAITPAAGFVNLLGAIIIGILAGFLPYFAVAKIKPALGYDDALDVFGIHGIAGILGALLTGLLADPSVNSAGKGLLYGNPSQLWIQALSVFVVLIYDLIATGIILLVIKVITGLRVSEEEELSGLDLSQHGERAYEFE